MQSTVAAAAYSLACMFLMTLERGFVCVPLAAIETYGNWGIKKHTPHSPVWPLDLQSMLFCLKMITVELYCRLSIILTVYSKGNFGKKSDPAI